MIKEKPSTTLCSGPRTQITIEKYCQKQPLKRKLHAVAVVYSISLCHSQCYHDGVTEHREVR
jgi:hypothetical protein